MLKVFMGCGAKGAPAQQSSVLQFTTLVDLALPLRQHALNSALYNDDYLTLVLWKSATFTAKAVSAYMYLGIEWWESSASHDTMLCNFTTMYRRADFRKQLSNCGLQQSAS